MRKVLLFFMSVLLALTAGRAFWVSLGENPFAMSGATYVEFFQQWEWHQAHVRQLRCRATTLETAEAELLLPQRI